jgi:hypothetical protein
LLGGHRFNRLHRFFFFIHKGTKGTKKSFTNGGRDTGHRGMRGGISNPPCMADTKKGNAERGEGDERGRE